MDRSDWYRWNSLAVSAIAERDFEAFLNIAKYQLIADIFMKFEAP
jgi:hypothetical protein